MAKQTPINEDTLFNNQLKEVHKNLREVSKNLRNVGMHAVADDLESACSKIKQKLSQRLTDSFLKDE